MIRYVTPVRAVLLSTVLLGIGMGVYLLALGQLLFRLSGGPAVFALALTLQGVGAVCVLPFSGPLVDAFDSRAVYLLCSVLRAGLVSAVAAVGVARPPGAVPLVATGVVLLAVVDNVQRAAVFKFTAQSVGAAARARLNGLLNVALQVGALTGMALLGLALLWLSVPLALLADALVCLVSAALMAAARPARPRRRIAPTGAALRTALPSTFGDWRAMLRRHRGDRVVLAMLVLCAADFVFQSALSTLIVPYVSEHYGGRGQYVSVLEGTFALGMVASALFLRHTQRLSLLPVWGAAQAAAALALSGSGPPALHFGVLFVAGWANLNSVTLLLTTLQERAAQGEKGKMASLRLLAIGLGTLVLMPLVGHAAAASVKAGFLALSTAVLVFTLLAAYVALRHRPTRYAHPAFAHPRGTTL